jgi:hypothetical protein
VPSDKIAVIAIDDESIANLGRWPWPREIHAKMIDVLTAGHAKVIGYTVFFFEPQVDAGLSYIYKIADLVTKSSLQQSPDAPALNNLLLEAVQNLNSDQKLSDSMAKANDVLLGTYFELGAPQGKPDQSLPDYMESNNLPNVQMTNVAGAMALPAKNVLMPIPMLGGKALAMGHLNSIPDVDGAVRTEPLLVDYYDQYYPSLSLALAAKSLNLSNKDIVVNLGESVDLGNHKITTDAAMQMHSFFYKDKDGKSAFPVDSFYDVYSKSLPSRQRCRRC